METKLNHQIIGKQFNQRILSLENNEAQNICFFSGTIVKLHSFKFQNAFLAYFRMVLCPELREIGLDQFLIVGEFFKCFRKNTTYEL